MGSRRQKKKKKMEIFYNVIFFFFFNILLGFKKESYLLLISIAYGTYAIPCHDLGNFLLLVHFGWITSVCASYEMQNKIKFSVDCFLVSAKLVYFCFLAPFTYSVILTDYGNVISVFPSILGILLSFSHC